MWVQFKIEPAGQWEFIIEKKKEGYPLRFKINDVFSLKKLILCLYILLTPTLINYVEEVIL